ncbi:phenylalanine--tRNA ligase subunit beta [Solimonas marina]|uniref:Phenylalanine--tRNA ligase beta subunit n=1 Tax=Solimonas marina TaxID=2714601 RepID=A0A969WHB3_9GAMM|nr:phenylalanine--tRNA ligase subunit beta [Solimonas marina]NKF24675.1 phenylalanine--tRNA ligase subunit beta [Solimonas marina]
MKLSENWLREWVNPAATIEQIAERLVMGGLELEIEPAVAGRATQVVVAKIVEAERHPQADRLQVCKVDAGTGALLQIVCGAPNARPGIKVPCAVVGATLPGGMQIGEAKLRGVESFGMLCSASELGLAEKSDGLVELEADARIGMSIDDYFDLDDHILNLEITPNRGDCLSVVGLARDISALYGVPLKRPTPQQTVVEGHEQIKVEIESVDDCPSYVGRVITKLNAKARTPDWMRERLRRSGIRSIHPVVDITNYVMLELGQPMHAFDAGKLSGNIRVRRARDGESLQLLNEQTVECRDRELLISDDGGPIALAGVMGGLDSGVQAGTTRIFFESACFAPTAVAGTGRRHKLFSDASYRYERGVDPALQRQALERATQLVLQICGGETHPVTQAGRSQPEPVNVRVRRSRIDQVLGHEIPAKDVETLLGRLGIALRAEVGDAWMARVPSHRYDLRIEADLIEEVGRLYGYDRIPARPYQAQLAPSQRAEAARPLIAVKQHLAARGWQEAISLAFVEPGLQTALDPQAAAIALDNPIADNLSVMRTTLWAGLIPAWLYNRARQQDRVRLFEAGVCFALDNGSVVETSRLAGLAAGRALPEQWGSANRPVDFYDLKAEVVSLFGNAAADYRFEAAEHPALHPGRCARIVRGDQACGWIGELHPKLVGTLDLPEAPLLFELDWTTLRSVGVPKAAALSEFPSSRRDLAVVVAESVSGEQLLTCARQAAGELLSEALIFDIYRGTGLKTGEKSVALGLLFNNVSRTLTLSEIDTAASAVTQALTRELNAVIRQ